MDASRRAFFRGRPRPKLEIRPPWALLEAEFLDHCTRCNECLKACPQDILISGDGGYPTVDFRTAECTFCGDCVVACKPAALKKMPTQAPWPYKAKVGDDCLPKQGVECRVCGDFCDPRAITFPPRSGGSALPAIDLDKCTGCGACVAPCPVSAMMIRL